MSQDHKTSGFFRTVRGRLLFWTLLVTIPIYASSLYMSYQATAQRLEQDAERSADELVARMAAGLDAVVRPIEGGIRTVGGQLEEVAPPREQYEARIRGILQAWPEVYGSTIAVEVDPAVAGSKPFAPYLFRRGDGIAYSDLARDSYGYRDLAWYRRVADSLQPDWSLPYFDEGGGDTWMVTYSVPFFRRTADHSRVLAGVVTADLDLKWMRRVATNEPLRAGGMGWLYTPPGARAFIAPIGPTQTRLKDLDAATDVEALRGVAEKMLAGGITFARVPRSTMAQPAYLAVRNLETLDWRVMIVTPRAVLLAEANRLLDRQLWLGAAGLILLIAAISIVAAGISRPLHTLAESVGKVSEDHPDFQLPEWVRNDEIGVLTEALRRMRDSLQRHIHLRAESLAAQARLEHELHIAASIQQSMLPRVDAKALPPGAAVAAALIPAKQVGGDLYDYFKVGDDHLLFAIGDVSDKGIPAALFMARLSGLLRVLGSGGELPHRLLAGINGRLVEGNEACMFVTLSCGLLNVRSGEIRCASAGHDPPLVREFDGKVRPLMMENGPAIGIETLAEYHLMEGFLAPGDTLVLFTDGATEAEADDGSMFGVDRLKDLLSASSAHEPESLVQSIVATLTPHTQGGFRSTDDLSILAIGLNPPDILTTLEGEVTRWTMQLPASASGVNRARQWLRAILASRVTTAEVIHNAEVIAEEMITNIVRALAEHAQPRLQFECALGTETIYLTTRDNGPPFDPLAQATPDLDAHIVEREIGGLGILLIRQLAERCRYSHADGCNILEVELRRTANA